MNNYTNVIIGGGAAGFAAAIRANGKEKFLSLGLDSVPWYGTYLYN